LDDCGIKYKSYTEQFIDSSGIFKDVIISLLAVLAQQEKNRISERVQAGLATARKKGRIGGRPRISDDTVEKIIKLNRDGLSLRKIAQEVGISHRTAWMYINN